MRQFSRRRVIALAGVAISVALGALILVPIAGRNEEEEDQLVFASQVLGNVGDLLIRQQSENLSETELCRRALSEAKKEWHRPVPEDWQPSVSFRSAGSTVTAYVSFLKPRPRTLARVFHSTELHKIGEWRYGK